MKLTRRERFKIGEQAALRLLRAGDSASPEVQADVDAWAGASAHHIHELLFMDTASSLLDGIDPHRSIDVDALPTLPELVTSLDEAPWPDASVALARGVQECTSSKDSPIHAKSRNRRRTKATFAVAACFSVFVAGLLAWFSLGTYRTGVGEQRTVKLEDGSVMVLNTASRAEVRFSEHERSIHLLEGEALFLVEHDKTRPFRVFTDSGVVTAVGTRFAVDRHTGETRVAVVEGVVRIAAAPTGGVPPLANMPSTSRPKAEPAATPSTELTLRAREEAVVTRGHVDRAERPDVQRAVAWQTRELIFRGNALAEVAAEFNRYNAKKLVVEGDELRTQNISGTFSADNVETLVEFFEDDPRFIVMRGEREIVIRLRNSNTSAPQL